MHLFAREHGEEVLELCAVAAEPRVVPERRPALGDAFGLCCASVREAVDRFEPVRPRVHPVGVSTIHGIAQHHDEPCRGNREGHADVRGAIGEVEGSALTATCSRRRGVEQCFVLVAAPDPLFRAVGVARSALTPGWAFIAEEEFRLLHGREIELGVREQRAVQRRRSGFGRADDHEVRKHAASPVAMIASSMLTMSIDLLE